MGPFRNPEALRLISLSLTSLVPIYSHARKELCYAFAEKSFLTDL